MPKLRFRHLIPAVVGAPFAVACLYSCASGGPKSDPNPATKMAKSGPKSAGRPETVRDPASSTPPSNRASSKLAHYNFERPKVVKGIYLTAWSAGSRTKMAKMLGLLDRTELNSVVIDVRDTGDMYFKTGIPLAMECSPKDEIAVTNPSVLFNALEKHKVWPIARIACFRDNWVPLKHPELAVQLHDGTVWHDRSRHSWLDPYNKKNWDYLAATVDYALDIGFPEIQLDYVRFPSEGKSSTQVFPGRKAYPDQNAKQEDVIAAFAKYIGDRVHARGAEYSSDIFGIISSNKGAEGIGQQLEKVAAPFDVISPMVYPSHFARGEYGIADPNRSPYAILIKSLGDFKKRLPNKRVRPWLQDFSLGYHYGPAEVKAELKALREVGYEEFLLWNAGNHYTEAALAKEASPVADAKAAVPAPAPSSQKAKISPSNG